MSFAKVKTIDNERNRHTVFLPYTGIEYPAQGITLDSFGEGEILELIDINNLKPAENFAFSRRLRILPNPDINQSMRWYTPTEAAKSLKSPCNFFLAYIYSSIHNRRWQREYPLYRKGIVLDKDEAGWTQLLVNIRYGGEETQTICGCRYMKCDGFAFEVGDNVVVKYEGDETKPVVIGFWDFPRTCWFEDWEDDDSGTLCKTNHWGISFIGIFGEEVADRAGWDEEDYNEAGIYYSQWRWADCEDTGHPQPRAGTGEDQTWPSYKTISQSVLKGRFVQQYPPDYDTNPFDYNHYAGFIYTFKNIEQYPVTPLNMYYPGPSYPAVGTDDLFSGNANCQIVIDGLETWYEGMYASQIDHPYHFGAIYVLIIDSEGNTAYFLFLLQEATVGLVNTNEHIVYDGGNGPYTHSGARVVATFKEVGLNGRVDEIRLGSESTWQFRRVPCFSWDKIGFFPPDAYEITYTDPR